MAGTIVSDTIQNGAGTSTSTTNVINGSAKAWVNFNGGTGAIRGSYNVSSVTRNSNGNYTIAYTNSLANANYAILVTPFDNGSGATNGLSTYLSSTSTTNTVIIVGIYSSGVYDATYICATVFS